MNTNWLSQLAPEHAPAPPSWWPLAPGWWVVAGLCLLLCIASVWWWHFSSSARQRKQRRIALAELRSIRTLDRDGNTIARAIQNLMRRYALAVFGHERVATLSGDAWLSFVAEQSGAELPGDAGHSLLSAAFGQSIHDQREQWLKIADGFIHHAPRRRRSGVSS